MNEMMRLTRTGDLAGAAALVRSTLGGDTLSGVPPTARQKNEPADPGSFIERSYRQGTRSLDYRLYRPVAATHGMPVVVMLHGCTQSPEDFALGTRMNRLAEEFGVLVVYPRQTQAANAQRCWNWFNPADQQRDQGEPALIAGATRQVIADEQADPRRVYVAGLSAGGAAAAIMGAAYPDLYAAIGIHSGLDCGVARDLPSAMAAMRTGTANGTRDRRFVPVITFHGDQDRTVHEANSRQIVAAAVDATGTPLRTTSESGVGAGGQRYTREMRMDDRHHVLIEQWTVHGAGHAWSGGSGAGSFTDPAGPDASGAMLRFFLKRRLRDI